MDANIPNSLPQPVSTASSGDASLPVSQSVPIQATAAISTTDTKVLLANATIQVEELVARTPTDPATRASEFALIKAAYIKAQYGMHDIVKDGA